MESPEWVKTLPAARDESVDQLFIVAGFGMDSIAASVSLHQRDENGQWQRILSTPDFVGKNGLCLDDDHVEGFAQTPVGTYCLTAAFGIAEAPTAVSCPICRWTAISTGLGILIAHTTQWSG